jgi:hypothetical protein
LFSSSPRPNRLWVPCSFQSNGYRGRLSWGIMRRGREADHSPPSIVEVKNAWSYTSILPYVFMAWCLVKDRENYFTYRDGMPLASAGLRVLAPSDRFTFDGSGEGGWRRSGFESREHFECGGGGSLAVQVAGHAGELRGVSR